jgi:hypothetical protein
VKRTALSLTLAAALAFASGAAFAHGCPKAVKAIDEALPTAKVSDAQKAEVKKLRDEGDAQHKAGKHDEAMASLNKAKGILSIK